MNKPDLYLKNKTLFGSCGCERMLEKYYHLLEQSCKEPITMVDIGCGPGNVAYDVLMPLFKTPVRKIIGWDISEEMINFATATYGNEKVSFKVVDLTGKIPEEFVSYFDFVFSFWALHWIQNQRQLFANIHKIMKPNGQMFVTFIARTRMYDIYQSVWSKPQYSNYITDFTTAQTWYQNSNDPVHELKVILEENGFDIGLIKIENVQRNNYTANELKEFLMSINPVFDKIPSHLQEQFILDHVKEVNRCTDIRDPMSNVNCDLFVVYAKKK